MQTIPAGMEQLEAVVRRHLKFLDEGESLPPDGDLGEAGLDSMASIDLLLDLEESFGVAIDEEALTENSFATLESVRELVEASRG